MERSGSLGDVSCIALVGGRELTRIKSRCRHRVRAGAVRVLAAAAAGLRAERNHEPTEARSGVVGNNPQSPPPQHPHTHHNSLHL